MYFDCNISAIYSVFQFISMEYNLQMRDSNPSCQMQTCFQDVYWQQDLKLVSKVVRIIIYLATTNREVPFGY